MHAPLQHLKKGRFFTANVRVIRIDYYQQIGPNYIFVIRIIYIIS